MKKYIRYISNIFASVVSVFKGKYQYELCKWNWRKMNPHNYSAIARTVDLSVIRVGESTYGPLNVKAYGNKDEKLIIGSYCSIAPETTFLLGGNHHIKGISTYPFKSNKHNYPDESWTKGPIIIKDDVWIGSGALILSGVTIEQGAIIAARAVVTKNVPPYAIVAGNPARIVKYRFSEKVIARLLELDLKDFLKTYENDINLLYEELTDENIDCIISGNFPNPIE